MDRAQILLVGLPLFLLCTDLIHLFTPPPPKPPTPPHPTPTPITIIITNNHQRLPMKPQDLQRRCVSLLQKPVVGGIGLGSTVRIDFCASCSYRGNAATMKKMLETQFPGIDVVLVNYPPSLPKRVAAKLVPVFQVGVMGIVLGGEQIFPMIGLMAPPPWYYTLRANKFGTIASTWLLGNALQSFLQSSGAFEVYCNDELVFSKLMEARFPGEIELKDLVGRRLANSGISDILL
ncbi:selenoprotein [Salix suchowensis]|nr:selenoprotein [Salix suchowensis]